RAVAHGAAFLHDRTVDRTVAFAGAILVNGLVADPVLNSRQTALFGAATLDGIATGAAMGRLRRVRQRRHGQYGSQRQHDLQPHLWTPRQTVPIRTGRPRCRAWRASVAAALKCARSDRKRKVHFPEKEGDLAKVRRICRSLSQTWSFARSRYR